jgi:hypothetical protein
MGVNPLRFAVAASGALACLMIGLVAGVRAGANQTAHVMSVETVTRTAGGDLQAAVARTVTVDGRVRTETLTGPQNAQPANAAMRTVTETVRKTVHDPVTVTETLKETETVQGPAPAGPPPQHKDKDKDKDKDKPKPPHDDGPGDGDGGGDGG